MFDFENLSPEDLNKVYSDPFYCLSELDKRFFEPHEAIISEELWIEANANIIEQIGSREWLRLLLENLKGNYLKPFDPKNN